MRFRIFWIIILIKSKTIRSFHSNTLSNIDIMLWGIRRNRCWSYNYFSAIGTQSILFFQTDFIRHSQNGAIAFCSCQHRDSGTGIS